MKTPLDILLPYQKDWTLDQARFKLGLWSRQTGKSFSTAAEAVRDSQLRKTVWVCLSAGERQALEWMQKAREWTSAFDLAIESYAEQRDSEQALLKAAEINYSNGSRLLALPANPNTARGYSANLILDEFAFHEKPNAIWRAIYPSISNPLRGQYKLRIVSTANGKANKFYDLWTKNENYSKHLVDIYTAVQKGLPIDIAELKAGLDDPDGWAQEYECQFIDASGVLLPYELLAPCEHDDCIEHSDPSALHSENPLYLGVDIGRKHDLTVVWLMEKLGDTLWTRGIKTFEKTPYAEQLDFLDTTLNHRTIKRACIDATGIGAMLAETLAKRHGKYRAEECQFTAAFKEEIFLHTRRTFEDKLVRIPVSRTVREDLHGLQKLTTTTGSIRIQAPRNEDGHCDRATALALALHAAKAPTPLFYSKTLSRFTPSTYKPRARRAPKNRRTTLKL